jgi:hypothetical protein
MVNERRGGVQQGGVEAGRRHVALFQALEVKPGPSRLAGGPCRRVARGFRQSAEAK